MRKPALLLFFMAVICTVSVKGQTPVGLTDADWLSAAKTAIKLTSRNTTATFIVDDSLSSEARHALESLQNVIALADVPDRDAKFATPDYLRVFQFRLQGDRIEFMTGSVYPKNYQAGDCRIKMRLFLVRAADGEWKQDGQPELTICSWH
jgi:hypothetical protein